MYLKSWNHPPGSTIEAQRRTIAVIEFLIDKTKLFDRPGGIGRMKKEHIGTAHQDERRWFGGRDLGTPSRRWCGHEPH